uniref:Uncharacterized protein n=1 Tax=Cynoglossus semilaevis TaxID=244447 RepID=A0A3P8V3V4_CYNSE
MMLRNVSHTYFTTVVKVYSTEPWFWFTSGLPVELCQFSQPHHCNIDLLHIQTHVYEACLHTHTHSIISFLLEKLKRLYGGTADMTNVRGEWTPVWFPLLTLRNCQRHDLKLRGRKKDEGGVWRWLRRRKNRG